MNVRHLGRRSAIAAFLLLICVGPVGCRQPLHVSVLQVGRSLNGDNTIATHTTRFKPDDTIYASVLTDRTGSSTIRARWSYNGQMVSETEKRVSYKGDAATEFHFQSAGGFPPGDYKVEIFVDGQPAVSRDFRVE
jgi:hypothetical protein